MIDISDANGVKIVQELILTAKSGGGYVTYVMPKFNGDKVYRKLSYTRGIPEWEWYVGAGVNIEEIDSKINQKRTALENSVKSHILNIVWILAAILIFILLIAKFFSNRIRKSFSAGTQFFSSGQE